MRYLERSLHVSRTLKVKDCGGWGISKQVYDGEWHDGPQSVNDGGVNDYLILPD